MWFILQRLGLTVDGLVRRLAAFRERPALKGQAFLRVMGYCGGAVVSGGRMGVLPLLFPGPG